MSLLLCCDAVRFNNGFWVFFMEVIDKGYLSKWRDGCVWLAIILHIPLLSRSRPVATNDESASDRRRSMGRGRVFVFRTALHSASYILSVGVEDPSLFDYFGVLSV